MKKLFLYLSLNIIFVSLKVKWNLINVAVSDWNVVFFSFFLKQQIIVID
jgi:hypothetical protein